MLQIGATLRQARKDADLTQEVVAKALGVSLWTYNRLEHNRRQWNDEWLARLPGTMRAPVAKFLSDRYQQQLRVLQVSPQISQPQPQPVTRMTRTAPVPRITMTRMAPIPSAA